MCVKCKNLPYLEMVSEMCVQSYDAMSIHALLERTSSGITPVNLFNILLLMLFSLMHKSYNEYFCLRHLEFPGDLLTSAHKNFHHKK